MAAPTITLDQRFPLGVDAKPFGIISGTAAIASYDTAHPEVTAITGKFRTGTARVFCGGSSNGFLVQWDATTKSFKAYTQTTGSATAFTEVANAVNVGNVQFLAIGQLG